MIQDIKLKKITPAELTAVVEKLTWFESRCTEYPVVDEKQRKNMLSIISQVRKKMQKRLIDKSQADTLSFSLKYYEAYAVWSVLVNVENSFDSQQILNQIDQKIQ